MDLQEKKTTKVKIWLYSVLADEVALHEVRHCTGTCIFDIATRFTQDSLFKNSVPNPDPDPDLYIFRPPGNGALINCTDPDPSINKQKHF